MQPTEIAAQAVAILGSVAASGVSVAQGVATKIIGDLISERLHHDGHEDAWREFLKDPQNDSLVRHLIREAVHQDQGFREELEAALPAAVSEAKEMDAQRAVHISGSGGAQVRNEGDVTTNSQVAKGGGIVQGGMRNTIKNSIRGNTTIKRGGGAAIVLLVVLVLGVTVLPGLLASPKDGGLTANSTCRQFLNADQGSQTKALADIGIVEGLPGYSSPLSYWNFDYECGATPDMKIGARMKQLGNP